MAKMGCFEDGMDSRIAPSGSASSASGYSLRSRGSSAKISPFCPRSSSKLTQYIIKDHMISHYKRVYSAKAAIDTSVPKSLLHSVKYNDQLKQSGSKNSVRPQSAQSLSQRSRASCSPAQSRLSLQFDRGSYLCSSRSLASTPRPSTSFHPRSTVYPSHSAPRQQQQHRPSSERGPPLHTSLTSAYSALADTDPGYSYRSYQDPAQKTYSGDLLQKHAQHFTGEKPFTPKTLKSDKSSYLSKYRYYRSPHRNHQMIAQDGHTSGTKHDKGHRSTNNRKSTRKNEERSQGFSTDQDFSEDDLSHLSSMKQHRGREKSRPIHREEELKYLEFITAVTDDILSRGFISDSVVERVINRHIDMNQYHLNEGKMRHLLEVLRKDLKEPCNSPIDTLNFENQEDVDHLPDSFLQDLDHKETKDDTDQLHSVSAINTFDSIDYASPVCASMPVSDSEKPFIVDPIDLSEEKGTILPHRNTYSSFSEDDLHESKKTVAVDPIDVKEQKGTLLPHRSSCSSFSEDDLHESKKTVAVGPIDLKEQKGSISPHRSSYSSFSEDNVHENQLEKKNKGDVISQSEGNDTPVKEHHDVGDLGTALESLNVSDQSHCEDGDEEPENEAVSDDEF